MKPQVSGRLSMCTDSGQLTPSKTCKLAICRNYNIMIFRRYNANGEAVYQSAALGLIMDTETGAQKFSGGKKIKMTSKHDGEDLEFHRDDIISIDVSTDRKTVVTGETGQKPKVCVWSAETGEPIMHFELPSGSRGCAAVSLSPCGRYVATADLHNDHRVTVYNIQR